MSVQFKKYRLEKSEKFDDFMQKLGKSSEKINFRFVNEMRFVRRF